MLTVNLSVAFYTDRAKVGFFQISKCTCKVVMFLHIDYAVRINVVMCKEVKPISCFSKDIKILIFPYSETAMELLFKFYPSG